MKEIYFIPERKGKSRMIDLDELSQMINFKQDVKKFVRRLFKDNVIKVKGGIIGTKEALFERAEFDVIVQHEIENLTGVKMLYNIHYVK